MQSAFPVQLHFYFNKLFFSAPELALEKMLANLVLLLSLAPYERRVIELLRNSKDKRARKLAKKRVRSLSLFYDLEFRCYNYYPTPQFPAIKSISDRNS